MNHMENQALIELRNISKTYIYKHLWMTKKTEALRDVSLEVRKNEVFGLIGLNGSGKTTLLKILLGLIFKTGGNASVFGIPVPSTEIMKRAGYLPEIPYFLGHLTPVEALELYADLYGMPSDLKKKRIPEALALAGMEKNADVRMKGFSKGMLQRVGFASCILNDPELLLLDEPTTGLDPLGIITMRNFIKDMHGRGKTIFFSSHLISEIEKTATRVAIIKNGSIVRIAGREEFGGHLEKIFFDEVGDTAVQELK